MQHKEYRDFIGLYEGVYPDGYCRHMIDEFERLSNTGATYCDSLVPDQEIGGDNPYPIEACDIVDCAGTCAGSAIIDEQNVVELPWHYNIGSWKGMRSFLGSDKILERPSRDMLSAKGLDKLGEFNDEEQ